LVVGVLVQHLEQLTEHLVPTVFLDQSLQLVVAVPLLWILELALLVVLVVVVAEAQLLVAQEPAVKVILAALALLHGLAEAAVLGRLAVMVPFHLLLLVLVAQAFHHPSLVLP
jgi:hypothetical protein